MRLEVKQTDKALEAVLDGSLDAVTAPVFETRLGEAMRDGEERVILDVSGCEFISSAGLRVLLGVAKRLPRKGGGLFILSPAPAIKDVLEISGFDRIVNVIWNAEDAFPPL